MAGALPLFSNVTDEVDPVRRSFLARPRTILIDSEELESGEALSAEFKQMAGPEIEAFKSELRLRGRAAEAETLSDADLLREVMNTVGQQGRLGEQIRCVVSVSMLTEGWDARTVTHVVGVRAFGTQLLCEQVVGRALRRVSYEADENSFYAPEYADVLGIPFNFIPAGSAADFAPPKQVTWVRALKEREAIAIDFPRVLGYRLVLPPGRLEARFSDESRMVVTPDDAPPSAVNAAIVGENVELSLDELRGRRNATVAFHLAGYTLRRWFRDGDGALKPWLYPALLEITRRWMEECLRCEGGTFPAYLCWESLGGIAARKIYEACVEGADGERELRPVLDAYNGTGSSQYVRFATTKTNFWITRADKCQVDRIVLDSDWEAAAAQVLEEMTEVVAYVRNERLGFEIPYVFGNEERFYRPDFIAVLKDGLRVVLEVKGQRRAEDAAKFAAVKGFWVPAVNAVGRFGRWEFAVVDGKYGVGGAVRGVCGG